MFFKLFIDRGCDVDHICVGCDAHRIFDALSSIRFAETDRSVAEVVKAFILDDRAGQDAHQLEEARIRVDHNGSV